MTPAGDDNDHAGETGQGNDGLGESTAPAPDADAKVKGRSAKQLETV